MRETFVDLKVLLGLRFLALCMFLLSVYYPHGYYKTCHERTNISWFQDMSWLYYLVVSYLVISVGLMAMRHVAIAMVPDLCSSFLLVCYFLFDFFTGSVFQMDANMVVDYFFSSLFNILTMEVACGSDVGFNYQIGYLFYIAFIVSFLLSTFLGFRLLINGPTKKQP